MENWEREGEKNGLPQQRAINQLKFFTVSSFISSFVSHLFVYERGLFEVGSGVWPWPTHPEEG